MKDKLCDEKFNNFDELFQRLKAEWDAITPEVIHHFYSSFKARTIVCARHNGDCRNIYKTEVTHEHDKYRTHLEYVPHPLNPGMILTTEKKIQ